MGLFKKILKKVGEEVEKQVEKIVNPDDKHNAQQNQGQQAKPATYDPSNPPTRWEKAVVGLNGIVAQVSKIDRDGVDIVCFPGSGDGSEGGAEYDMYRNLRDATGLEAMVSTAAPGGPCHMGKAMDVVLNEAFARGFEERPTAILVLTAGRPDDHEDLSRSLSEAAKRVGKDADLTVTFVQIGDDDWAESYLSQLDTELITTNADGEEIDIVDTIKDEEIQTMMNEVQENEGKKGSGTAGALFGAFAGAALGAGGVYLANQMNAKKRTEGWIGTWKVTSDKDGTDDEIAILDVKDDMDGNLEISGWPDSDGVASVGSYADNGEGGYSIQYVAPGDGGVVVGTVEDEHSIRWDNGMRWEEVPPKGAGWGSYAGGAAAGAATVGAAGYLLDKKFFHKASEGVPSDYVIVLDRSRMMGKNPPRGPPPPQSSASSPSPSSMKSGAGGKTGVSNKDAKYEDVRWAKMPVGARQAAKALWFDRETWDEGHHTEIEEYGWWDLSDGQRRAAGTLGWSEEAWDHRYNEHHWSELPAPVQRAAEELGFDESIWDGDEWPEDVHEKSWGEMTREERRALHVLGYWQNNWKK